jgi:hypothetical protein
MARAKGRAGAHTTLIEAAIPVVKLLEKHGRVSRGMIEAGIRARSQAIKVMPLPGGLRITVVSKGSRQELHVYGITLEKVRTLLSDRELVGYNLNLPAA